MKMSKLPLIGLILALKKTIFNQKSVKSNILHIFGKMIRTYEQCIERFGSKYLVKRAVAEGVIFQLEPGVYSDRKNESDIAIVAAKYPKGVITLNTAFYCHGLTDSIPDKIFLNTTSGAKKIADSRVVQKFEKEDVLRLGATTMLYADAQINIYNKERMLLELIRHKNNLPYDYYKEIIGNYRKIIGDLDLQSMQEYLENFPKAGMINKALQLEVF